MDVLLLPTGAVYSGPRLPDKGAGCQHAARLPSLLHPLLFSKQPLSPTLSLVLCLSHCCVCVRACASVGRDNTGWEEMLFFCLSVSLILF